MKGLRAWLVVVCVCGCGGDEPASTGAGPGAQPAAAAGKRDDAEAQRKAEEAERARQARIAELTARKEELASRVAELKAALEKMEERHAKEREGLADPRELRPYFMRLRTDAAREAARLKSMEERLAELEQKVAHTEVNQELKTLQAKQEQIEKRYWDAHSSWMASLEDERFGAVNESPVKRDLDLLRAIRQEWFEVTPPARRGTADAGARKIINDAFRAWLRELPDRKRVVSEVVGSEPDRFDFTELEFYILLSKRELALEKLNIAEEKKELDENLVKLQAIEEELDAVREQIALKLAEGGGDLEVYQDLKSRIQEQRTKAADLQRMVVEKQEEFARIEQVKERQRAELEEAHAALEEAEKALRETVAELRR